MARGEIPFLHVYSDNASAIALYRRKGMAVHRTMHVTVLTLQSRNSHPISGHMNKPVKVPSPDHPITVEPTRGRVVVKAGGKIIVDTRNALTLQEATYPAVQYIPRSNADMAQLTRTAHTTYCPYKGDASYYSVAGTENAVWSYESPHPAMAAIKDYLAFYTDRVDAVEVSDV